MKAGELIGLFRQQADDTANPPLWRDDELMAWLNEAEVEACRRARLLVDSRGTAVTVRGTTTTTHTHGRVTLGSGTDMYDMDERIIYLRRVKLAGRTLPLEPIDYRDMDARTPGWEDHTGTVSAYVRGLDSRKFRPYRIPTAAGTCILTVVREPLLPMVEPEHSPEIPSRYHINLLEWVFYRAYMKKDSQAYDANMAAQHLALFEAEFGTKERATAFEEEWARNNLPHDIEDGNF